MDGTDYDENTDSSLGYINEASLDAWIGPGGKVTQSTDETANNYYEGVGSLDNYIDPDTGGAADQSTTDLFNLYTDKFNRNPDAEGLEYWENELARRTTGDNAENYDDVLANIGASFDASVEDTIRGNVNEDGYVTLPNADDVTFNNPSSSVPEPMVTVVPTPDETASTSYGGGTQANNYITDQSAYEAEQTARAANLTNSTTASNADANDYLNAYANLSANEDTTAAEIKETANAVTNETTKAAAADLQQTKVDNWLSDIYADLGINDGVVDQGGRDYWTEQLGKKSKAEVERDIAWAAANN